MTRQILTILFVIFSVSLFGQESATPFRKANTIILHTTFPDSVNFIRFQRQLMKFDYFVDKTNPDILTITTSPHNLKRHPGWTHTYMYQIIFLKGTIIIKPFLFANTTIELYGVHSTNSAIRWHYTKSKSNTYNIVWKETLAMLHDYCKCQITYR